MKLNEHDLDVLQATTEGRAIQFEHDGQWIDCTQFYTLWTELANGMHLTDYRVKPDNDPYDA